MSCPTVDNVSALADVLYTQRCGTNLFQDFRNRCLVDLHKLLQHVRYRVGQADLRAYLKLVKIIVELLEAFDECDTARSKAGIRAGPSLGHALFV